MKIKKGECFKATIRDELGHNKVASFEIVDIYPHFVYARNKATGEMTTFTYGDLVIFGLDDKKEMVCEK